MLGVVGAVANRWRSTMTTGRERFWHLSQYCILNLRIHKQVRVTKYRNVSVCSANNILLELLQAITDVSARPQA